MQRCMAVEKMKISWFQIISVVSLIGIASHIASAQQAKKPFTVADEIGLTLFDDLPGGRAAEVLLSPDGNYFAIWSERGRVDLNRVEDSLRFYRRQDVEAFLKHPDASHPVTATWIVHHSANDGPTIHDWRWLADSSGVAFLESGGYFVDKRLVLADIRTKRVEPLTSTTEEVGTFDVRDREH